MKFRSVLVGLCLLLLSLPTFAQDNTAEWGDLGLEVDYPDDWDADDENDSALLVVYNDELAIFFYAPREADTAEEAIEDLIDSNEEAEDNEFEFEDMEEAEVMGEEAFRVDYESPGFSGFSLAFEFDGMVLLLDAGIFDEGLSSRDEDTLLEIIETIRPSEGGGNGGGGDAIESVLDEDATGEDIVEELIDLELVTEDGEFLFEEDEVVDAQDLPESYEGGDIAMGAIVSWERADGDDEDGYRVCGFIAQSNTDDMSNDEGTLLITGLDSDSAFVTFELDIEDVEEGSIFEAHDSGVDVEDPSHMLVIIQDDELWAFINGELIVEAWELDITAGDDELFAGFLADTGCVMTNVWAYSFE